jgi:hypothetical protein
VNRDVVVQTVTVQTVTVLNAIRSFERLALSGKSPATKQWYSARLSLLARALGETRPLADVLEVDLFQWREGLEVRLKAGTLALIHCMGTSALHGVYSVGYKSGEF